MNSKPKTMSEHSIVALSKQLLDAVRKGTDTSLILSRLASMSDTILTNQLPSDTEKLTFWLNVYNAMIRFQLIKSPELFEKKKPFFTNKCMCIAGQDLSFDTIEHGILRRSKIKYFLGFITNPFASQWEKRHRVAKVDYRIHFALNCGAKDCPLIRIYDTNTINAQLNLATKEFVEDKTTVDHTNKTITTSSLFKWYIADFGGIKGIKKILQANLGQNFTTYTVQTSSYNWEMVDYN